MFFLIPNFTKISELAVFVSLQNLHQAVYDEASPLSTKRGIGRVIPEQTEPRLAWPTGQPEPEPDGF